MLKRLLWTGIYGLAAVLLWLLGDYFLGRGQTQVSSIPSGGVRGGVFIATPGFAYLGSVICLVLSFLALVGKLPRIPDDEPNI